MTDINIIDLAREVLGDELDWDVKPSDTMHHEDIEAVYRLANAAPTLARAVIDLTAKVERVEALAKGLDHEADMIEAEGSDGVEAYVDAARSDAYRIRKALNGDDR